LTAGQEATYAAVLAGGETVEGSLPLPPHERDIHHGLTRLTVRAADATYQLSFDGGSFPGSHGLHFQDYRSDDRHPGCYRVVLNFGTEEGNEFDYTWRIRVEANRDEAAHRAALAPAVPVEELPKTPDLPGTVGALGDAAVVPPRASEPPAGELQATISESGEVTILDGEQTVLEGNYFQVFPAGRPQREEVREGESRRVRLHYDAERGEMTQEVVVFPDEAWVLWTVRAKQETRGEVGFFCPQGLFSPPCITWRSVNQSMVAARDEPELGSTYCIVTGDEASYRELQFGTSRRQDWMFQDYRESRGAYRVVAVPRLAAGEQWRAVFRYLRRSAEPYPEVSFDAARRERGILATLLPDAMTDGFTIVPARSARYTVAGRPMEVTLKYVALDEAHRTVRIDCRLVDQWDRPVAERSYRLRNGGERCAAIRFPVLPPLNGAYRLEMAYRSGDVQRTRELVLTVLPEVADTGYRPESVFGAAIGGGEYLATLAKRIGLKWNRGHCAIGDTRVDRILPQRGEYDWERTERAVEVLERYDLLGCSTLNEAGAPWLREIWDRRPFEDYLQAWIEEYVRPLAERFRGRIRCWEVTNEPYYQYRDCPEKWVALMRATYETLKQIDPECTVVGTCGPPGSMGYSWYRRTFGLGSLDYQDAVSSHLYHFGPWVGAGVAMTVREWMHQIRRIMAEHGKVLPLWNSETTVTPPASLYTHPSHTRYVRYHAGEGPTDPIEQAQTYFKVLVVHAAEGVKYSFHIFHGGVEYTSHTGEYDETPLAFVATQAALAKHLETAQYLSDVELHPELQIFLFRDGERLIAIPWGPMFLKTDSATVRLPIPAGRFTARDCFDNPLPVEGDAAQMLLTVTWEGFFLLGDGVTEDEFRRACGDAAVDVRLLDEPQERVRGRFFGEDAGPARRSDWVGYHA
ncbi:MAG: hypothetical protein ACP5KN_19775, partial [Armatimonadota bacterium]